MGIKCPFFFIIPAKYVTIIVYLLIINYIMKKYLSFFLKTIWLEQAEAKKIINNPELKTIEEKVKSAVIFILNKKSHNEVEFKVKGIDLFVVTQRLENLWASKIFDGIIEDNRYDFINMLFKSEGILLRTREADRIKQITLKREIDDKDSLCSKWLEMEKEIDDIDAVIKCFNQLWLRLVKWKKYRKHRISYVNVKDWVRFDFDKYLWIDWLLEIESDNEEKVQEWKIRLWLENYKTVKYWYRMLREEERKKKKEKKRSRKK